MPNAEIAQTLDTSKSPEPLPPKVQPKSGVLSALSSALRLLLFVIAVVVCVEITSTQRIQQPFVWLWKQPLPAIFNAMIVLAVIGLSVAILGRLRLSAICAVLLLFF